MLYILTDSPSVLYNSLHLEREVGVEGHLHCLAQGWQGWRESQLHEKNNPTPYIEIQGCPTCTVVCWWLVKKCGGSF